MALSLKNVSGNYEKINNRINIQKTILTLVCLLFMTIPVILLLYLIAVIDYPALKKEIRIYRYFQDIFYVDNQKDRVQAVSLIFQGVVSTLTLVAVVYATFIYANQKDKANENSLKRQQALQEITRMSSQLYDLDFYVKIIVPSWEVAVKWMYWKGPDGDSYRYDIIAGTYLYLEKKDRSFYKIQDINKILHQSIIRDHPHYKPYGIYHEALDKNLNISSEDEPNVIHHLSEHNAITIWFGFWVRIAHLRRQKWIEATEIREAFGDFYGHWYTFFTEYRRVAEIILGKLEKEGRKSKIYSLSRVEYLEYLESIFDYPEDCYVGAESGLMPDERADEIARQIWDRHKHET